uniref:Leucine zipper tumor suppressor 1 n=1 Tax=Poecilia latipinna TaxID=48699 RepID=A0A3B3VJC2_9TELE
MGSVSSLVAGNSLNSKHCKASDYRLKEGTNTHRKSGGCNLDGLLKCGFAQSSSSTTHHSRGLSHSRSGRSEDFFYIKVRYCKYDTGRRISCRKLLSGNCVCLQKENGKLQEDLSKLTREKDLVELRLRSYEKESTQLVPTLEETQWEVCQKSGEISLLKQQLRDCQADVSHKLNEIVSLKASLKENTAKVERLEQQNKDYEDKLQSCTREKCIFTGSLQREVERLKQELREEKNAQGKMVSSFELERQTWNQEKDRVIKYQKQLQINYLQMHKKNKDLERILKELTAELESRTELGLDLRYSAGLQTYEDVIATEI